MSALDNMNTRLNYLGGGKVEDRMQLGKLRTLKKALFASYQGETAILSDGREFKCLINRDVQNDDKDAKILSIPFEDICLNSKRIGKASQGIETVGIKPGDIFQWKENGSYWLVFLQYLEEEAYFRGDIRKCNAEVNVYGKTYPIYSLDVRDDLIRYEEENKLTWNKLDYKRIIYITKNEDTVNFFHRFTRLDLEGNNWEVQSVRTRYADNILQIFLREYYTNSLEGEQITPEAPEDTAPEIQGDNIVSAFDLKTYTINNEGLNGKWSISNIKKARISSQNNKKVIIEIITGRAGTFDLIYTYGDNQEYRKTITINSL